MEFIYVVSDHFPFCVGLDFFCMPLYIYNHLSYWKCGFLPKTKIIIISLFWSTHFQTCILRTKMYREKSMGCKIGQRKLREIWQVLNNENILDVNRYLAIRTFAYQSRSIEVVGSLFKFIQTESSIRRKTSSQLHCLRYMLC